MGERSIFGTRTVALRALCIAVVFLCGVAASLRSQYREIPLPYRDTTRVKVQFLDSLHGWVVNYRGTILRTTDGGVQWTEHHFTADSTIDDFEFVDQRNGWLLFAKYEPGIATSAHRLYTTSDAGSSWVKVQSLPDTVWPTERPNRVYWKTPFSRIVPARNIEFVDSNTVYMETRSWNSIMFWRTTNRGQTWEELRNASHSAPFNQTAHHLEVLDSLHWFVVHTHAIIQVPLPSFVTTTSDGGGTWETTGYWDDEIVFNVCQSGPLEYAIFPRFMHEVLPGYAKTKYSVDGGQSWREHDMLGGVKMGYILSDTSIWYINGEYAEENQDGRVLRGTLTHLPVKKYPTSVRWLSKAGDHLFALTGDGRLIVFDSRLVGVESPQHTEKSFAELTVYPNPAHENVHVVYPTADRAELVVSDLHGRILYRQTTDPGQPGAHNSSSISIRDYPPGVYHLQISTSSTRQSRMILKY